MGTHPCHCSPPGAEGQYQRDISAVLMWGAQAAGTTVLGQPPQSLVEEKCLLGQIHLSDITSWEYLQTLSSGWKEQEEGEWCGGGGELCFCYSALRYLLWNWLVENLWALFLPLCLGLKRAARCNKVWNSPSSTHSLLAPAFINGKSFRFEAKSLVGEDSSRQKARGTACDLRAGCVTRTIWKYCKEQTDPGDSVNSLPCEH